MKKLLLIFFILAITACTTITKMDGEQVINEKMIIKIPGAWNKVNLPQTRQPYEIWTQEGISVDQLRFWSALTAGSPLIAQPPKNAQGNAPRVPIFTSGMKIDQMAALMEQVYNTNGSIVSVSKIEPTVFAGQNGVRLEFSVLRQASSSLQLQGVAWMVESKGQLFAMSYVAPRLHFFPRASTEIQTIAKSIAIKG